MGTNALTTKQLATIPAMILTPTQAGRFAETRSLPPFLFNAFAPQGVTSFNAGGKYYVNSAGLLVNAAAGVPYIHHVWDSTLSAYRPVGLLWEPAVQNLFTQSETLAAGGLTPFRATAGADADVALMPRRPLTG